MYKVFKKPIKFLLHNKTVVGSVNVNYELLSYTVSVSSKYVAIHKHTFIAVVLLFFGITNSFFLFLDEKNHQS